MFVGLCGVGYVYLYSGVLANMDEKEYNIVH